MSWVLNRQTISRHSKFVFYGKKNKPRFGIELVSSEKIMKTVKIKKNVFKIIAVSIFKRKN